MRYRFSTLFVMLLAMLLLYPALHGSPGLTLLAKLLLTAMYIAAARALLAESRNRTLKLALGIPAVLAAWMGESRPGSAPTPAVVFFHAAAMLFLLLMLFVVLRAVYREALIQTESVFAALCGYVILGVAFGHAYCILHAITPESFQFGPNLAGAEEHLSLSYFSFVTLTTVGYGDVLPGTRFARSLCVLEALLGQCYIAVLVADLIGKRLAQPGRDAGREN